MAAKTRRIMFISFLVLFLTALTGAQAYAQSATLSWEPPTTNTDGSAITALAGYKVHYGTSSGNYTQTIDVGNATTYQVTGLSEGLTYFFATTAYNTSGLESAYSNEVSKAIPLADDTPPVISGIYESNITSHSSTINWTTDEPSDSQVEYGPTLPYGHTTILDTSLTSAHTRTLSGLQPSTRYNYRVLSRDASGNLAVSENHSFTTPALPDATPPVISGVRVINITESSVTVTWTTDEPSSSRVEYGLNASYGDLTPESSHMVTTHSIDISGLSSYSTYHFRTISEDASGNQAVSPDFSFMTSNLPPVIISFSATPAKGHVPLLVEFDASVSDTDGHVVSYEWDFDGDGKYDEDSGSVSNTSHIYTDEGVYSARLKVTDDGGAAALSAPVTVRVESAANRPPVVSSFTATPAGGNAPVTVTFTAFASDPDGSVVTYEWDFDGNGVYDASTTSNPVSHTYTSAGTYSARVRVTDNLGATADASVLVSVTSAASGQLPTDSSEADDVQGACFIATAAYGSYLAPDVKVLREFRDKYLGGNPPGRLLIAAYYRLSPPVAGYISKHEPLRAMARLFLTPVVYGIKYPMHALTAFIVLACICCYSWIMWISDRRSNECSRKIRKEMCK